MAIATLPLVDAITIGGRTIVGLSNLIVLYAQHGGGSTSFTTFRKPDASSGYAPSGVAFRCFGARYAQVGNGTGNVLGSQFGYGDTDSGLLGSAPTAPIYIAGDIQLSFFSGKTGDLHMIQEAAFDFLIPDGKFPFASGSNSSSPQAGFVLFGKEE